MEELEKFLNWRSVTIVNGWPVWVGLKGDIRLTTEETFKFLTLSAQAYRESLGASSGSFGRD